MKSLNKIFVYINAVNSEFTRGNYKELWCQFPVNFSDVNLNWFTLIYKQRNLNLGQCSKITRESAGDKLSGDKPDCPIMACVCVCISRACVSEDCCCVCVCISRACVSGNSVSIAALGGRWTRKSNENTVWEWNRSCYVPRYSVLIITKQSTHSVPRHGLLSLSSPIVYQCSYL